jgi:DNA-binding SARP family transcriptional activator
MLLLLLVDRPVRSNSRPASEAPVASRLPAGYNRLRRGMEFRILGPVEVIDDGRTLDLGGARQRALLAVLLLHRREPVSSDRLIEDVYGDRAPPSAAKSLQAHVSRLRKALGGDGRVLTRGGGYVLEAKTDEVDADRFAALLEQGRRALGAGDAEAALSSLATALRLWRGPPLADLAYEPFAQAEAARLEELRLSCLEERFDAELALGRHAGIVGDLELLAREHPLRERLHAQLMLALYRCGRQADALAVYRRVRAALDEELGLEPGRALQDMERAILRQEADLDADARTPAPEHPAAAPPRAPRETRKTVSALHVAAALHPGGERELDVETLRRVMAEVVADVRTAVERHGGRLEAVTAGGVTAVFGIPTVHEDDALRALLSAEDARAALAARADRLRHDLGPQLETRLGVATGPVIAGGTDDELRATGLPLTAASRLAAAAASGELLADEPTARLARAGVLAEPVGVESGPAFRIVEVTGLSARDASRFAAPMVGRERELRRLTDAFEQAVSDRSCQLFTILGSAGVGKSRLARELLSAVDGRAAVVSGRCLPYGEGITYWPVVEAVHGLAGLEAGDSPDVSRLRLAELLAGRDDAEAVAALVAEAIGAGGAGAPVDEIAGAVRTLLETAAARQPLVVVFDDVHWGEPTFLELVESLAAWSRGAPMLLLCLARPELLDLRPGWGGGTPNTTTALLEPLSHDECARLIAGLVGEPALAAALGERIAAAAEGNPLYVEEMLSMLIDDGVLRDDGGRWASVGDLSQVPVPPTIQALLAARLDQLGDAERAVVETAAVEGKVFHRGWLETAGLLDAAVGLAALVRKELVRPDAAVFAGEQAFRFRHLLIRDAAYEAIPKDARADLHERHARWLEGVARERAGEFAEIVGYHLEQAVRYRTELGTAGDAERALGRHAAELLGTAGRRAFLRSDGPAGVNLISRAVALLTADDPLRVDLVPNVRAVQGMSDLSWADRVLTDAVETAATTGDRQLASHALVQRGFLRLFTGAAVAADELTEVAGRAAEVFAERGDELGLARAWRLVAQAEYLGRSCARCAAASERALPHARRAGDRFEEREIVEWLVIAVLLGPAPAAEAIARCEGLLAETSGDPLLEAQILGALAPLFAMQGRAADADDALARGGRIMEASGEWIWIVFFWRSMVHLWRDDALAAERELRPAYDALKRIGEQSHFSSMSHGLANALYLQGRYEETEQLTRECEAACRPNDVHSHVLWRSTRAKVLARRGEHAPALELAHEAVTLAEGSDFLPALAGSLEDLSKVLHMAGRRDEARAALEQAIERYEEKGNLLAAERGRRLLATAGG